MLAMAATLEIKSDFQREKSPHLPPSSQFLLMSGFDQWLLLLRIHTKMFRVKAGAAAKRSRFMSFTIGAFLFAYVIVAYTLFRQGLVYINRLPAASSLVSDRLVFVMFFCFMLMLLFSVAVTGYMSLYRNRDTKWLLTLPISHRVIFLWKCFESAMFSSWGLVFILAPLLAAFARARDAGPDFFIKSILVLIPFLIISSTLGSLLLIAGARWLSRKQILVAVVFAAALLIGSGVQTALTEQKIARESSIGAAQTFQRVLRHTNISVNRALPSAWLSSSIVDFTRTYRKMGNLLFPTLLVSNSMMGMILLGWAGTRWFYTSWNRSIQHSAVSAIRRENRSSRSGDAISQAFPKPSILGKIVGRPIAAISRKDIQTFLREPAQWVQFCLVFGLLAIYASGLRQMNGNIGDPRDLYLVAFLNLAVCALALSTLTTRFVFPQFSLEGRRIWILAMSPLKLPLVVIQKFVLSTACSGLVVTAILLIGGYNLELGFSETAFFAISIALLAAGLNSLAVGIGVLFPNLRESNAAKIVSGFGGTLCLVASFVYILAFIGLLAYLRWDVFATNEFDPHWYQNPEKWPAIAGIVILTVIVTVFPLIFSQRKLKRLEIIADI
ncbi:MAG: hypothetical protein CMO55_05095 [Verrucomicrobiales bacterium]|nr:hypothetical protein [Verrucomicrobiales bacterium]